MIISYINFPPVFAGHVAARRSTIFNLSPILSRKKRRTVEGHYVFVQVSFLLSDEGVRRGGLSNELLSFFCESINKDTSNN